MPSAQKARPWGSGKKRSVTVLFPEVDHVLGADGRNEPHPKYARTEDVAVML